jgi:hypothetical protein
MNDIFREWFNDFVVIYIDDILINSSSLEEHVEHLRKVFQKLRQNNLYAKLEKCEFGVTKVDFLGHRLIQEGLKMDDHKVKAIVDWVTRPQVPCVTPKGSKELDLRNWLETWCRSQLPTLKGVEGSCWKLWD